MDSNGQPKVTHEISIITATLNRPSLRNACESINEQTYTNWHHYVIGDGILPVNYPHSQRTTIGFTRPIGAQEPTSDMRLGTPNPILRWAIEHLRLGTFVCFLDDDNAYRPHFLEKMVATLLDGENAGIALCMIDDQRFNGHGALNQSFYRLDEGTQSPPFDGFPCVGRCDNSAFLAYSHLAKAVGFPLASPEEEAIQDFLFIKALADQYGWIRVPERLVLYGIAPNYAPPVDRLRRTIRM